MNSGLNTFTDRYQSKFAALTNHALRMITVEGGFPHSEIFGSKLVRSSPKLNAAYHVLHRLLAPRHPPNALKTLDCSHSRCPLQIPLGRVELQTNLKSATWTVNIDKPVFFASIMFRTTRSGNGCLKDPCVPLIGATSWVDTRPNIIPLYDFKLAIHSTNNR